MNSPSQVPSGYELYLSASYGSGLSEVCRESYRASDGTEYSRLIDATSGSVLTCSFYDADGMTHRENGPADLTYFANGRTKSIEYRTHGKRHRDGGLPARMEYYEDDGSLAEEVWYVQGELSRIDGPTWVSYRADGPEPKWWNIGGLLCTPDRVFEELLALDLDKAATEIEASVFGPLLVPGVFTASAVLELLGDGVRTVEGIRAIRDGAPAEWARAWESGSAA